MLWVCAGVSVLTTIGIVVVLMVESLQFFSEVSLVEFLTETRWTPLFADKHYGIFEGCGSSLPYDKSSVSSGKGASTSSGGGGGCC